jgi:hypothetical protein
VTKDTVYVGVKDAKEKFEAWRQDYIDWGPHSSLDNLTPNQYFEEQEARLKRGLFTIITGI